MASRQPPEMVSILAPGWLGFFSRVVVSAKGIRPFLFFFVVDVSRDRRLSPFTREPAMGSHYPERGRTNFFTWIWRKSSAFEHAEKRPVAKEHHVRERKREWRKNLIIGQDSKVAWFCLFIWGEYSRIIWPKDIREDRGISFFLFLYFREASCMAPPSRSWDALLFLARVISLEISIEFLDYRWRKSLECMNLSCINHHDFAKM